MLYNQIIELLMWDNKPPIIDDITDLYNRKCLMTFNHIVYSDKKLKRCIFDYLNEMNFLNHKINLISPEIKTILYRYTLTGSIDKIIAILKEFVKREMFVNGIDHHEVQPGYNISCTHYIKNKKNILKVDKVYEIPILYYDNLNTEMPNIPAENIRHINDNIKNALDILFSTSETIKYMFLSIISSISIKVTNKNTRSASSQIEKPENIQVVNPLHYSKIELSEQLLHESIHSLLYLFESQYHPITLRDKNGSNGFEFLKFLSSHSPWTGNFIGDVSLAHAIFVYFGISNYYIKLKDIGLDLCKEEIDRGIMNTCFGFLSTPDIRKIFTTPEIVYDWSMDAFKLMQSLTILRTDLSCNQGVFTDFMVDAPDFLTT